MAFHRCCGVLFAATLVCGAASPAFAHAILVRSEPAVNVVVRPGDLAMTLVFNSRIDGARSRLTLTSPDHSTTVLPIEPGAEENLLLSHASVQSGPYVVRWQVLATDGHITRGDVPFTVEAP